MLGSSWGEYDLPGGSRHDHVGDGLRVAEEVGADALLGLVVGLEVGVPVGGAPHEQAARGARLVVPVPGGGDGVQAHGVGLTVLLARARGDDTPALALDVGEVPVVVDDDVAGLARGLGAHDALLGNDLAGEGGLALKAVHLHVGVVVVGGVLQKVLLQVQGGPVDGMELELDNWNWNWNWNWN